MKRILSVLLVLSLVLGLAALSGCGGKGGSSSGTSRSGASGSRYFKTPEAAAEYFVGCIRKGDVEGALAAFPIDERVAGADFISYAEYTGSLQLSTSKILPPVEDYPYYDGMAREFVRNQITSNQIFCFIRALTDVSEYIRSINFAPISSRNLPPEAGINNLSDLRDLYDPTIIQGLTFQQLIDLENFENHPDPSLYHDHLVETLPNYFGDVDPELAVYAVLCQSGEENYLCAMKFLKFSDGWKLWELDTSYLSFNPSFPIEPISEAELRSILKDGV